MKSSKSHFASSQGDFLYSLFHFACFRHSPISGSVSSRSLDSDRAENAARPHCCVEWMFTEHCIATGLVGVCEVTCGNAEVTWPPLTVSQSNRSQSYRLATSRYNPQLSRCSRAPRPLWLNSSCIEQICHNILSAFGNIRKKTKWKDFWEELISSFSFTTFKYIIRHRWPRHSSSG
jgi:hypothetical protein